MNDDLSALAESIRPAVSAMGLSSAPESGWEQAIELGWLMTAAPETVGGLGLGVQSMTLVAAECGRGLLSAPITAALTVIDVCSQLGEQTRVEPLMNGEFIALPMADCVLNQTDGALSGGCVAVECVDMASQLMVWTEDAASLWLVPLDNAGVHCTSTATWDRSRVLAQVTLSDVSTGDAELLVAGDAAREMIERLHSVRALLLAADCNGAAEAVLQMSLEHLKVRHQFGRPLAMFQALKHRVADLRAALSGAQALLVAAAQQLGAPASADTLGQQADAALLLAQQVFAEIAEDALQLHGGIGMAAEYDCHRFLKRAMLNAQLGGQRGAVARRLAAEFIEAQR